MFSFPRLIVVPLSALAVSSGQDSFSLSLAVRTKNKDKIPRIIVHERGSGRHFPDKNFIFITEMLLVSCFLSPGSLSYGYCLVFYLTPSFGNNFLRQQFLSLGTNP